MDKKAVRFRVVRGPSVKIRVYGELRTATAAGFEVKPRKLPLAPAPRK